MTLARVAEQRVGDDRGHREAGSGAALWGQDGRGGVFQYSGDEPARWNVEAGVWLQGYWCYDWYDEAIRVKTIDRQKKLIAMAAPAMYGIKQGNPSPRTLSGDQFAGGVG
jgi:hypothetical protein